MYLLVYSIDYQDYLDRCDEEPWVQEGEKQYVFGESKDHCIEKLLDDVGKYDDEIYENEYHISQGNKPIFGKSYLTLHEFLVVEKLVAFDIKGTQQYKDYVKEEFEKQKYQQKFNEQEIRKRELAELKRLKEKYEDNLEV